jgi:hypothetical protein
MVKQNLNPFSSKKTGFFIEDQLVSIQMKIIFTTGVLLMGKIRIVLELLNNKFYA